MLIPILRTEPHITTLMQHGLMALGHALPRFGADGDWGEESQRAYAAYLDALVTPEEPGAAPNPRWPSDDIEALLAFYGRPDLASGRAPRSAPMQLPYPMQLSWGQRTWVTRVYTHELVGASLYRALSRIQEEFGPEGIRAQGLDQLGGITNVRYMRGSRSKISRHSFGIAIDLDPLHNGLRTPWPGRARMPAKAIECFEAEGWVSYGRLRGLDAMHFQATRDFVGN